MMWVIMFSLSFAMPPAQYEFVQVFRFFLVVVVVLCIPTFVRKGLMSGAVNLMAGMSFPLYLMYLYRMRNSLLQKVRARFQHRLLQCLTVTILLSVCAVARGILQLTWRQLSLMLSREVYWCFSVCSYAVFEMMPMAWLLVLFRVVPLESNFVLVGTPDSDYWINRSTQSVAGHDFYVVGKEQATTSGSSGSEEQQHLLN